VARQLEGNAFGPIHGLGFGCRISVSVSVDGGTVPAVRDRRDTIISVSKGRPRSIGRSDDPHG
jgi:hypothetical protein